VFAGGCFLCAASAEMDGRPGPVRDAVAAVMGEWLAVLSANVDAAIADGELRGDVDLAATAFRLTRSAWRPTGSASYYTTAPASSTPVPAGERSSRGSRPAMVERPSPAAPTDLSICRDGD